MTNETIDTAALAERVADLEEAVRLAEVGEYLLNACLYSGGDGYTEPREMGIEWQWQQSAPDQYGQGMLLASATKWHDEQAEDGIITEARQLRDLRDALAALLRGVVWQPIETAERWIKITCGDDLPKKPGIERYEYVECLIMHKGEIKIRPWNCEHLCWDDEYHDDFYCDAMEPSHWMPLPAPPLTSKEG